MARATSSSVNPPSGPTANDDDPCAGPADRSIAVGLCGWAKSRKELSPAVATNSARRCGEAISISRLRPHCFDASTTARRSRARACSIGWATAAGGFQRHEAADAQLDRLFDQPFLPLALGQGHAQHERPGQFAIDLVRGRGCPTRLPPGAIRTTRAANSRPLPSKSVTPCPGLQPHHVDQVMGFRPAEHPRSPSIGLSTK